MASEIKVDTISEKTSANGVTIDGVSLKDSKIATANSIDSDAYVDGSIDAVHLSANSVDSDAYVDGSIDTAHIGATQVTGAKLNTDVISAQTALASEPADTDEFMVSDAGVLKRIDYSLIKGGGLANADQWRVTTSFTGSAAPIASNWEQNDSTGFGALGSAMTESSGIFTFPSTGYWLVIFKASCTQTAASANNNIRIQITTDNSSYSLVDNSYITPEDSNRYESASCFFLFDVTSTSLCKVRFDVSMDNTGNTVVCSSTAQSTGSTFLRLADT